MRDGTRARYDHGLLGDNQGLIFGRGMHRAVHNVVHRSGAVEDRAGSEHRAALDYGPFVNAAIPTENHFVLNNDRKRTYRLEYAANLHRGGDVATLANLCATAHQRVGIHHGAFADIRAGVDEHGRHTGDALPDEATIADARSAWHDAHAAGDGDSPHRVGGLVKERLSSGVHGHIHHRAHAEPEQDAFL